MSVFINNEQNIISIESDKWLSFINEVLKTTDIKTETELSVTFVNNERIQELNKQFRNKDYATDVLSFPFENELDLPIDILGDIIISTEKAVNQSEEYNHSLDREISFLITHGILHLLGYDHQTDEDEKIMFDLQKKILSDLGVIR